MRKSARTSTAIHSLLFKLSSLNMYKIYPKYVAESEKRRVKNYTSHMNVEHLHISNELWALDAARWLTGSAREREIGEILVIIMIISEPALFTSLVRLSKSLLS